MNNRLRSNSELTKAFDSDQPTTEDLLDFEQYTIPIANRIAKATVDNTPFTIGIYGKWGSGKSSFLEMIAKELRNSHKIDSIFFNAWKYDQEENLWSALIQVILDPSKDMQPARRQYNLLKQYIHMILFHNDLQPYSGEQSGVGPVHVLIH